MSRLWVKWGGEPIRDCRPGVWHKKVASRLKQRHKRPMLARDLIIVLTTTMTVYASIYAPQPILPLLVGEFGLTVSGGALLMTAVMLPLSIAPLLYGLLLESLPAKRMLLVTIGVLSLLQAAFGAAESYGLLIANRLLQGACVPAILAALTSYLAYTVDREHIQRAMTYFVAANIMGGLVGRVLAGWVATNAGWRYAFFLIALALAGSFVAVSRMKADSRMSVSTVTLSAIVPILRNGDIARLYAVAFTIFFAFMALLTFLPFRLKEVDPSYTAFVIGMMYSGYIMGIIVSAGATRIIGLLGGERKAMTIGLAVFAVSMLLINVPSGAGIFAIMFFLCGGMFFVHATAMGTINKLVMENRAVANGLYISVYYTGAALGSWLPGLIYQGFGWGAFTGVLTAAIAGAVVITRGLKISG
jgi:MFS transporter, YNFM family, putative membrane transport protein